MEYLKGVPVSPDQTRDTKRAPDKPRLAALLVPLLPSVSTAFLRLLRDSEQAYAKFCRCDLP
jgi:hypothetical protein